MTQRLLAIRLLLPLAVSCSLRAGSLKENPFTLANAPSNEKDVVHVVVGIASNLKRIFNYCPFPTLPVEYTTEYTRLRISGLGVYRLIVDQEGKVTEIKILKRMGALGDSRADVAALKTFIRWQAKPGPRRVVDVTWGLPWSARVITTKDHTGSHIPTR
jgi:TonB family protein